MNIEEAAKRIIQEEVFQQTLQTWFECGDPNPNRDNSHCAFDTRSVIDANASGSDKVRILNERFQLLGEMFKNEWLPAWELRLEQLLFEDGGSLRAADVTPDLIQRGMRYLRESLLLPNVVRWLRVAVNEDGKIPAWTMQAFPMQAQGLTPINGFLSEDASKILLQRAAKAFDAPLFTQPQQQTSRRTFGDVLDALRKECGLTIDELAEKTGKLSSMQVQRHIRNEAKPELSTLRLYSQAFTRLLGRQVPIKELEQQ